MISEREDLLTNIETSRNTLRQLEAQNQELQRQSAGLDRDLLAERAVKDQKIKVGFVPTRGLGKIKRSGLCVVLQLVIELHAESLDKASSEFDRVTCLLLQDLSSAMKEVEELTAQLRKQQQQSQQTAQELEQLRKVHTQAQTLTQLLRHKCLRGPVHSSDWTGDGQPAAPAAPLTGKESNSSSQQRSCCLFSISGDLHSTTLCLEAV